MFSWALAFALSLFFCSPAAAEEISLPPSPGIVLPSSPTTPTESFVSGILRPWLVQALTSSESTDQKLSEVEQQRLKDDAQRKTEAEQRQKEQADSEARYEEQSKHLAGLQNFFDKLFPLLTDFSGSEDAKQAAALASVDGIKAGAAALERERDAWRAGAIIATLAAVGVTIYAAVK